MGRDLPAQRARTRAVGQHAPRSLAHDGVLLRGINLHDAVRRGAPKRKALLQISRVRVGAAVGDDAPAAEHELERELVVVVMAARSARSNGTAPRDQMTASRAENED